MTIYRRQRVNGLARLRASRGNRRHPSFGGSRGYSVEHRCECISNHSRGCHTNASRSSISRWRRRLRPFASTGNKTHRKLHGMYIFLLIAYRLAFPKCNADEMRAFLFRALQPSVLFSRSQIYTAERRLNLARQRRSTMAAQALLPQNLVRRQQFWTLPPPAGVFGAMASRFIDNGEAVFFLRIVNCPCGRSFICGRVRDGGFHEHDLKFTLTMGISPNGFKHVQFLPVAGTTAALFLQYIESLLLRLHATGHIFLWDDLRSHANGITAHRIYAAGHSIIPRPANSPVDGPIEYIFNHIEGSLQQRMFGVKSVVDFQRIMYDVIAKITPASIVNAFTLGGY